MFVTCISASSLADGAVSAAAAGRTPSGHRRDVDQPKRRHLQFPASLRSRRSALLQGERDHVRWTRDDTTSDTCRLNLIIIIILSGLSLFEFVAEDAIMANYNHSC